MHILTQLYIFQHRTIGQNADNCGIYRKSLKPRRPLSQAETSKAGVGSGGRELGGVGGGVGSWGGELQLPFLSGCGT